MKHATVMTIFLAAMIAGCGTFKHKTETSLESIPENERPNIETEVTGAIPVDILAGKRVFVSFRNSDKLTKVLSDIIEKNGGKPVSAADQADLVVEAVGGYFASRAARRVSTDVGEVIENAGVVSSKKGSIVIALTTGNAIMTAAQASLLTSGVMTVSNISGFSDKFNGFLTGDPDGICFIGCEYKQAVVIDVVLKGANGEHIGESMITSKTAHRKLWPVPLINAALNKLTSAEAWKQ